MATDHFGFSKLVVGDLERSAEFYKSVCGLTEQARVEAEIEGRKISEIVFHPTAENASIFMLLQFLDTTAPAAGETILGFITADIEAFVERARAAGGNLVREIIAFPKHGVASAFVRDVEDHLIEVVQRLPATAPVAG